MDIKRRKFLKIAGLSTIASLGAPAAFNLLFKGDATRPSHASAPAAEHGAAAASGKRMGMVINHKIFADNPGLAQSCITACHKIHNVPSFGNAKDEIKWLWEEPYENAFTTMSHNLTSQDVQSSKFLVTCNHCDSPPCVRVCPTKATYKNADGLVLMDFHRCIGCRFCMAACPYGSRSFNWRDPRPFIAEQNMEFPTRMRGVVEKCNFCAERLAKGLLPACVEVAGSTGAMVFGDLNDPGSEIRKVLAENFTIQRNPSLGTIPSIFYIV